MCSPPSIQPRRLSSRQQGVQPSQQPLLSSEAINQRNSHRIHQVCSPPNNPVAIVHRTTCRCTNCDVAIGSTVASTALFGSSSSTKQTASRQPTKQPSMQPCRSPSRQPGVKSSQQPLLSSVMEISCQPTQEPPNSPSVQPAQYTTTQITITTTRSSAKPATVVEFSDGNQLQPTQSHRIHQVCSPPNNRSNSPSHNLSMYELLCRHRVNRCVNCVVWSQ